MTLIVGRNATMVAIQAPPIAADPLLGIAGVPATNRWTGYVEAYIDEDIKDEVIGGERVTTYNTLVYLAANIPVYPNQEDICQFVYLNSSATESLIVRFTDGGNYLIGRLLLQCVRS